MYILLFIIIIKFISYVDIQNDMVYNYYSYTMYRVRSQLYRIIRGRELIKYCLKGRKLQRLGNL